MPLCFVVCLLFGVNSWFPVFFIPMALWIYIYIYTYTYIYIYQLLKMQIVLLDFNIHNNVIKLSTIASQINSLTIVCSSFYSRRRSKKTPKLHVTGLWGWNSPVNSPHKGLVTRKMFPFDDVIMITATSPLIEFHFFGSLQTLLNNCKGHPNISLYLWRFQIIKNEKPSCI